VVCLYLTHRNTFGGLMDFTVSPFDFDATEAMIVAQSSQAKTFFAEKFGIGAFSIQVLKSGLPDVVAKLEDAGFKVSLV